MIESSVYSTSHDYHAAMSLPRSHVRSSPIAIIQSGTNKEDEFDHSDSDESIIDVELDALKLRQKQQYGSKPAETGISQKPEKELRAPYLGSLSRSEGNLMSLPPMALSEPYLEDPPSEIMNYGSLRDSHQKGRFIDGPMSYREPGSGRIMQYDRRQKYQSVPPAQSIGERLQQSRKLKEIRQQKQEVEQHKNGENSANNNVSSSLSAMMNDSTTQQQMPKINLQKTAGFVDPSQLNTESFQPTFGFYDVDQEDPQMLSTSLTAFEILQTKLEPPTQLGGTSLSREAVYQAGFKPLARSMSDPLPQLQQPRAGVFASLSPMPPSHAARAPPPMSHLSLGPSPMNVHGRTDQGADVPMSFADNSPDMDGAFDMDM